MKEKEAVLYCNGQKFKSLVERTSRFVELALKTFESPSVSCSFGKDSSVMLHIITQIKPDIPVVFAYTKETYIIDNYEDVIKWWVEEKKINLHTIFCERETLDERTMSTEKIKHSWKECFVGIRADEGKGRMLSIRRHGKIYVYNDGSKRACPMAGWSVMDIEAYTIANGIPYLNTYKFHGFSARTTSAVPSKGRQRMLSQLKARDITAFNKMLSQFPELSNYV